MTKQGKPSYGQVQSDIRGMPQIVVCDRCGVVVEDSERAREQHDWTHMTVGQRKQWAKQQIATARNAPESR